MLVAGAYRKKCAPRTSGGQAKWPDAEEAIGRRSSSTALELWGESPGRGRAASASPSEVAKSSMSPIGYGCVVRPARMMSLGRLG